MEVINPKDVLPPQGGYSQGIKAGNLIFVAGQVGVDTNGKPTGDGGMAAQTRQTIANLAAVLRDAGAALTDVVSTTVFLKDFAEYALFDHTWRESFGPHRPARATVKADLVHPALLIEIQAIAVQSVSG